MVKKQKVEAVDILEEVEGVIEANPSNRRSSSSSGSGSTDSTTRISNITGSESKSKSTGSKPSVQSTQWNSSFHTIVVLTYNVLHEIGNPTKIEQCANDACIQNVCKFIDSKASECDFIGIQEYVDINKLTKYSETLRTMGHSHTDYKGNKHLLRYGPITFYDKAKYTPDAECSHMKFGFLRRLGRGIQINFFNECLCVINVHAGHKHRKPYNHIGTFEKSLKEHLDSTFCSAKCKQKFIEKLRNYAIIMLGDMNDRMQNDFSFTVNGKMRYLSGRTIEGTCCGDKKKMDGNNETFGAYDHILSTFSDPQKTITKVYAGLKYHSDHNPVKSTLSA
ncbi:MAG: endonuclease/exonuclease/phosphatase family protein [Chitinophagia bacterium]|nr:endonuclease/exonuclease/phosphatase family protein [Chitinophagia bacterium]